jgi:hypothetical protein
MAFKKQSVSEMWFWMTESHFRTCAQIPVHLSVSTNGCPDLTNQLPGQLAIDKSVTVHFSVMRCKKQVIPLCVKLYLSHNGRKKKQTGLCSLSTGNLHQGSSGEVCRQEYLKSNTFALLLRKSLLITKI